MVLFFQGDKSKYITINIGNGIVSSSNTFCTFI